MPPEKENTVLFRREKAKANGASGIAKSGDGGDGTTSRETSSVTVGGMTRANVQQLQPQPLFKKTEKVNTLFIRIRAPGAKTKF